MCLGCVMGDPIWTPKTVAVWQTWSWGKYRAFKNTFYGEWRLEEDGNVVIFSDPNLQEVMRHAKAIEDGMVEHIRTNMKEARNGN
jgi:hypothetical protein